MKKTLLTLSLILTFGLSQAQNLATENFNALPVAWTMVNSSTPAGTGTGSAWSQGTTASNSYINAGAGGFNGGATSYAYVGFNSTGSTGATNTISNWFITPEISLINGDVISFYTIKGLSGGATVYADNMQVRISTAGAGTVNPALLNNSDLGSFTTLAVEINPTLSTAGYPTTWTQYSYTVTGLSVATSCKVAFRYFVTRGGLSGANSDYIGIDQYSVDRSVASTSDFFTSNFAIYPNPVKDVLNVTSKNGSAIEIIQILDINGRIVNQTNANSTETTQINVSDLNFGVYFVKVQSESGVGTTKFIKN